MRLSALRLPLVMGALMGAVAMVRVTAWPLVRIELPRRNDVMPAGSSGDSAVPLVPDSLATIVSRDPFRIGRRPAPVSYDPMRLADQPVAPQPRPPLLLVGVIGGADPSAVIEGLPGIEGSRVVRVGDVVAGLRVKHISTDRVVVVGADTTWVLSVREPWKP